MICRRHSRRHLPLWKTTAPQRAEGRASSRCPRLGDVFSLPQPPKKFSSPSSHRGPACGCAGSLERGPLSPVLATRQSSFRVPSGGGGGEKSCPGQEFSPPPTFLAPMFNRNQRPEHTPKKTRRTAATCARGRIRRKNKIPRSPKSGVVVIYF